MIWSQLDSFPQSSWEVQVLVIVWLQPIVFDTSVNVGVNTPVQRSSAVANPVKEKLGVSEQSIIISSGQVILGGVVSLIWKVADREALFPQESIAVN